MQAGQPLSVSKDDKQDEEMPVIAFKSKIIWESQRKKDLCVGECSKKRFVGEYYMPP